MLTYIYLIAITAEGMSGALAAGRRNMDIFGVAMIAFITALGGGTAPFPLETQQSDPLARVG